MAYDFAPALHPDVARRLKAINPRYKAVWNRRREAWEIWDRTPAGAKYIVVFARAAGGTLVPITRDSALAIDLYTYLRRGEYLKRIRDNEFKNYMLKLDIAEEERQARIAAYEEYQNQSFATEAWRAFNMFARDHGWDSGKVKVPTIQGADITPTGVRI